MNKEDQNLNGLEAAYQAVYSRHLIDRVTELFTEYGYMDDIDKLCTELNPDNSVPCHWTLSELAVHYGLTKHVNSMENIPAAACGRCGGWTTQGGMSQHGKATVPVLGRIGCTGPHMHIAR